MLKTRPSTHAWLLPTLLGMILFSSMFSPMFSAQATASEDPLQLVPQDALGFAVVNRLSKVNEKLKKISQDLKLPLPDLLTMLKSKLGVAGGLDEKGDLLIAALPALEGQSNPQPLAALPVTDYKVFLDSFHGDAAAAINQIELAGQSVLVANKGAYAVLVNPENRPALKQLLAGNATRQAEVAALAAWIGENDGTVVLLNPGLKLFVQKATEGLEAAKKQFEGSDLGGGKGDQIAAAFGMYIQMLEIAQDEVHSVAKGLRIDAEGNFVFGARVRFSQGGNLAAWASAGKSGESDLLAGLPGGPFVGAFSATWSPKYSAALARWSVSMLKYYPAMGGIKWSAEEAQEYAKATARSMQGVRRMAILLTPGEKDEKLLENFLGVFNVDDADAYLANYEQALQVWRKMMNRPGSPMPIKMEASKVTVHNLKGLKISTDMKGLLDAQGSPPEATRMIERMFGQGGKISVHVLAAGAHTILLSYAPAESIERKVIAYQKSKTHLVDEPGLAKTASLLPPAPDMVAYLSPPGAVAWFQRIMSTVLPAGVETPRIADFPATPPIGFSASTISGGLAAQMVVPAELPKAVKEFVQRLRQ